MNRLIARVKHSLQQDPLLARVLRNTSYLFSSQSISMILAMGQSILATRLLGVNTFGILTVVMAFATNVNRLFSFRMGEFIIQFMGKEMVKQDRAKAGAIVKIAGLTETSTSLIAFVIYMLLVPIGVKYFAKDAASTSLFYLYGFFILTNFATETATGILQVTNRFKIQAGINLTQGIITASLITVAFLTKGSLLFVVWAYLIGKFITGLGPIIAAWRALNKELGRDWIKAPFTLFSSYREMVQFTLSTNLSGTVKMVVSESEPLLIGFLLNTEAVALYKIAISIVNPLMIPVSQFINTTYPEMTKSIASRNWDDLRRLLRRVTLLSGSWTVLFFLVMLIFGPWILSIWGKEFIPAYSTMMILIVGYGVSNIFFWNRTLLLSFGKANIPLYILAAAALLKTGLAFIVVPHYGINAEAWLLSGNFIFSVGAMVLIGMILIRRGMKNTPTEAA